MEKQVLNLKEFCEYVGIAKTKAFQLLRDKELRYYRNSKKLIFFRLEDVHAWQLQNEIIANPVEAEE